MDVDLDFSDDKIELFLKTKLEEVRLRKTSLQEVLLERKEVKHLSPLNEPNLNIDENIWKKIYNNKYCLCYEISNYTDNVIQDIKVMLWRNVKEDFTYKIELFGVYDLLECQKSEKCTHITNSVRKATSFKSKAYLVVVFDIPPFLSELNLTISGNLIFKIDSQEFQHQLHDVYISPSDFSSIFLQTSDIKDILTMQCCSNEDTFVLILPEEWDTSISNTFEIHCSFMKVSISSCSDYFVAYNISKLFDNTLLRVHRAEGNRYFLKTYTNYNNQLLALLHHLYKSISDIIILPLIYYNRYVCKNDIFSNELLQEFNKNLSKELENTYKYVQQSETLMPEEALLLQKRVHEFEQNTDELFLKLSNVKY